MRYAVITPDGMVDNVIEWDGIAEYDPGDGFQLVLAADDTGRGDLFDGTSFTPGQHPDDLLALGVSVSTVADIMDEAIATNTSFLSATDPNIADVLAQVQRLTVQVSKLIRYTRAQLTAVNVDPNTIDVTSPSTPE